MADIDRVLARSKKKSAFTWNWEIYFSLKPGISLWVWGHAVAPSRFLKFLCLWNGISRILGVILSKCSYKHVFNGVLTILNFYNYFLADPNWEIANRGIAEFLTVANTLIEAAIGRRFQSLSTVFVCAVNTKLALLFALEFSLQIYIYRAHWIFLISRGWLFKAGLALTLG
jgi:hypothetical protein